MRFNAGYKGMRHHTKLDIQCESAAAFSKPKTIYLPSQFFPIVNPSLRYLFAIQ